jgi:polysaccharide biosynthesis protein PslH
MKILFLSTWFPYPPDNGSKLRAYHLVRALADRHQVSLLSFAFDTARPEEPGQLRAWCRDIQTVQVNPFSANRASALRTFLSPRPVATRPIAAMSRLTTDTLRSRSFDAVIASTEMMVGYALAAPPGTVKILEEHNSMTRWAHERFSGSGGAVQRTRCWISWQKSRWYEARCYPRFDMVTMVSDVDRQATLNTVKAHPLRVEVVPSGVDCTHNQPGLVQPVPGALVYNGSLTYGANYGAMRWFLAEIYPRIRAQQPCATLTITGSTKGVDVGGLTLDGSVQLVGNLEDVRLPVAGAAACVVPIRHGGGTRLKILEAMALGTPVVATSKGAEGLEVADGVHLLLADDPESFANQTLRLLSDAQMRARLAANARRLVEARYDWTTIGAQFVGLVEEIAGQKNVVNAD